MPQNLKKLQNTNHGTSLIDRQIRELCKNNDIAYSNLDKVGLYKNFSKKTSFILHDKIIKDFEGHMEIGKKWIDSLESADCNWTDLNINVVSETCAIAWGLIEIKTVSKTGEKSQERCYQTWVFNRGTNQSDNWKVVHSHVSGDYKGCYS